VVLKPVGEYRAVSVQAGESAVEVLVEPNEVIRAERIHRNEDQQLWRRLRDLWSVRQRRARDEGKERQATVQLASH
jgi:hypothetical protein